ncbi:hypothetical protein JNJ66_04545 [Candidatus Saccharibacteria bacterium]|nr:hypothetical protein [Candidatus Saccharibacteria bacterium]
MSTTDYALPETILGLGGGVTVFRGIRPAGAPVIVAVPTKMWERPEQAPSGSEPVTDKAADADEDPDTEVDEIGQHVTLADEE